MDDVRVEHVKGDTETKRAFRILLACPRCRDMAQALLDASRAGNLDKNNPIGIVPCPDCAAKYTSGPAH